MDWLVCGQIVILMLVAGAVVVMLMRTYDKILKEGKKELVHEIADVMTEQYLPKVTEYEIEMTDRIMDRLCDKIPDMMEKTMNSAKKMMEEME